MKNKIGRKNNRKNGNSVKKPIVLLVPGLKTAAVLFSIPHQGEMQTHSKPIKYDPKGNMPRFARGDFQNLPEWLNEDGFKVYFSSYENTIKSAGSIEDCAKILSNQIKALLQSRIRAGEAKAKPAELIIISFSFGGLVARRYIDSKLYKNDKKVLNNGKDFIKCAFFTGTPHAGIEHRSFLKISQIMQNRQEKPSIWELGVEYLKKFNLEYKHTNDIPYYLISGSKTNSVLGFVSNKLINLRHGPNDGAVTVKSATALQNVKEVFVVSASHKEVFGRSYFEKTSDGKRSEAYERCIWPIIKCY